MFTVKLGKNSKEKGKDKQVLYDGGGFKDKFGPHRDGGKIPIYLMGARVGDEVLAP